MHISVKSLGIMGAVRASERSGVRHLAAHAQCLKTAVQRLTPNTHSLLPGMRTRLRSETPTHPYTRVPLTLHTSSFIPHPTSLKIAILLLSLLLAGCDRHRGPGDVAHMPIAPEDFTVSGAVDTAVRRVISAPSAGTISEVRAQDGMNASPGQVLARLNSAEVELQSETAKRRLAVLLRSRQTLLERSRVENARAAGTGIIYQSSPSEPAPPDRSGEIAAARADVQAARAQLDLARSALQERSDLRAAVTTADLNVQSAQQAADGSYAQVQAAQAQLPIEEDRRNAVKNLYQDQSASREELRTAEEHYQIAVAAVNSARAAYNRDVMGLRAAQNAAAAARKRLQEASDLKVQLAAAQGRYAQAVAAYRRAAEQSGTGEQPGTAEPSVGPQGRSLPPLPPDTSSVDSNIVQAQSDVLAAQQALRRLVIVAPVRGTVTDWQAEVGEYVTAGQSLGNVVDLGHLKITAQVRPTIAETFPVGSEVKVQAPGPAAHELPGRVTALSPVIDPQKGTQQVTIAVVDPSHSLPPGSSVSIRVESHS